jgi:hypothetical protein
VAEKTKSQTRKQSKMRQLARHQPKRLAITTGKRMNPNLKMACFKGASHKPRRQTSKSTSYSNWKCFPSFS